MENKQQYRGLVIHSGHTEYLNTLLKCLLLPENIKSLICLIASIGDLKSSNLYHLLWILELTHRCIFKFHLVIRGVPHRTLRFSFCFSQKLLMRGCPRMNFLFNSIWHQHFYFNGKQLIESTCHLKNLLSYLCNRPHFLWVYRCDNTRGMLGVHEKSL